MRVMIVEDQTMIRSLLESYFRAEDGYRITASLPGAKQAVEVCRTNSVDLILMDVQTENRENGLTAVRQIKAIQPKIKIIVVTSDERQSDRSHGSPSAHPSKSDRQSLSGTPQPPALHRGGMP